MIAEERLICFDMDEVHGLASRMESVRGLEEPGEDFFTGHLPLASVLAEVPEEGQGMRRFLFTVSLPEAEGDGLAEGLWSNAILNAATLILEKDLKDEAEALGLMLSEMAGPGIGGTPLELASAIVEMTRAERIGVSVSEDGVMRPPFTRCGSFIAGTREELAENAGMSGCAGCRGKAQGCALCIRNQKMV